MATRATEALLERSPGAKLRQATFFQASCGTLTVEESTPQIGDFEIAQCSASTDSVGPNDEVTFEAAVANTGALDADVRVRWLVAGVEMVGAVGAIDAGTTGVVDTGPITYNELDRDVGIGSNHPVEAEVVEVFQEGSFTAPVQGGGRSTVLLAPGGAGCSGCARRSLRLTQMNRRARQRLDPLRG